METRIVLNDRIIVDPQILVGKPIIVNTRLAVEFILELLAQGWSEDEIIKNYRITKEDISACLNYASSRLKSEKIYPIQTP
jgi:uncharacterized protein (DUF433 family)